MKRYEFDVKLVNTENQGFIADILKEQLAELNTPIYIDDKLLFWKHHFVYGDFTTYDNGHKKGGTLRFKDGTIRIPSYNLLPVYESEEYNTKEFFPRALTSIDKVIICPPSQFTLEELQTDGFESHEEMIEGMKSYYPTINESSMLSFYVFGRSFFDPSAQGLQKYFESRNLEFPWKNLLKKLKK